MENFIVCDAFRWSKPCMSMVPTMCGNIHYVHQAQIKLIKNHSPKIRYSKLITENQKKLSKKTIQISGQRNNHFPILENP